MAIEAELSSLHALYHRQVGEPFGDSEGLCMQLTQGLQLAEGSIATKPTPLGSSPSDRAPCALGVTPGDRASNAGGRFLGLLQRASWSRLALAASLLIALGASNWLTWKAARFTASSGAESRFGSTDADAAIAQITATRNCRWAQGSPEFGFGALLTIGQELHLEAGLAELTFADSGARFLLEGPARFRVADVQMAVLSEGRMAAILPLDSAGFCVRAAGLSLAEFQKHSGPKQGVAQFGLMAGPEGGAEVHVFEGPVRARVVGQGGRLGEPIELVASEAARLAPSATSLALVRAQEDIFVRSLDSLNGPGAGLYAYESFNYPAGQLAWQNGGFGWAGAWADLEAGQLIAPTDGDDPSRGPESSAAAATNTVGPESLAVRGLISQGGRSVQTAHRNRVRRALSTSIGGVFDAAGLVENQDGQRLVGRENTTAYVSFLQRVSDHAPGFYGFELHRSDGNANRVLCVGSGVDGSGYGVTSNVNVYVRENMRPLGKENLEVNMIVVRIDFGAENRDLVTVYRNPESLIDERQCVADATLRGNFAFDRISLGNFDSEAKVHEIDEVRVGSEFRAVTGQREQIGEQLDGVAGWGPRPALALAGGRAFWAAANCSGGKLRGAEGQDFSHYLIAPRRISLRM